jgi:ABC-type lipoprotein export system ATPase subunit
MSKPLLSAVDIHKSFPSGEDYIHVIRGLNLDLYEGDLTCILGPSGSGKSTLLHILAGIDTPDEGEVRIESKRISRLSERKRARLRNRLVGVVFQFHYLLPELTALDNVMVPLLIRGVSPAEASKKSEELLGFLGLSERLEHYPYQLSGGESQRVALARALIGDPRIVLADEPSGNLDKKSKDIIHGLLIRLNEEMDVTFLIATHDSDTATIGEKIIHLQEGKIRD